VPYEAGSRPAPDTQDSTIREYCRSDKCGESWSRLGNRCLTDVKPAASIHSSIDFLVRGVISKRTGRLVFCCEIVALELTWPPLETSDTRILSRSLALSLLSIARLNNARSRMRLSFCRRLLIAHISCGFSGGFDPSICPCSRDSCSADF